MDEPNSVYYSPYTPFQVPGGVVPNLMAQPVIDMAANAMGMPAYQSMGFNNGFSNPMSIQSKIANDKFYQDLIQSAAYRDRVGVANMLSIVPGAMTSRAGKYMTMEQQESLLKASQNLMTMAGQGGISSPGTRFGLDVLAGGNSQTNIAFGLGNIRKGFRDPFTLREHLSAGTADVMSGEIYEQLYGRSPAENRINSNGFMAGEQVDIMAYVASKGRLSSPMTARRSYADAYTQAAAKRGALTQSDLESADMGDVADLLGDDLSTPESKRLAARYAGGRVASDLQDAGKAIRAIKDIFEHSGIFMDMEEAMKASERMTGRYGQQLTGERISSSLRATNHMARNMGMTAREQGVFGDYVAGQMAQEGIQAGAEPGMVERAFAVRQAARDSGAFQGRRYGLMNIEDVTRASVRADTGFMRSVQGKTIATLERMRQMGYKATDPKLKQLFEELEAGTDTFSDSWIFDASPEQIQATMAAGLTDASGKAIGGQEVDLMMKQDFANEAVMSNKDLYRYRTQAQGKDYYRRVFARRAHEAYGAKLHGTFATQADATRMYEMLSETSFDRMSEKAATETDDMTPEQQIIHRSVATADAQLVKLEKAAGDGDAAAQAMLQRLGTNQNQQRQALIQLNESMLGNQGNYQNNLLMLNRPFQDALRAGRAEGNAAGWLSQLMAGSSNETVAKGLLSMAQSMTEKGQTEDARMYKSLGQLVNDKGSMMTEDQLREAVLPISAAYEQIKTLRAQRGKSENPAIQRTLAAKEAALGAQLDKLQKDFGAHIPDKDDQMGMAIDENGNASPTLVPGWKVREMREQQKAAAEEMAAPTDMSTRFAGDWLQTAAAKSPAERFRTYDELSKRLDKSGFDKKRTMAAALKKMSGDKLNDEQIKEYVDPLIEKHAHYEMLSGKTHDGKFKNESMAQQAKADIEAHMEKLTKDLKDISKSEKAKEEPNGKPLAQNKPTEMNLSGVTININGVEVGSNLTGDGRARRTEVPA